MVYLPLKQNIQVHHAQNDDEELRRRQKADRASTAPKQSHLQIQPRAPRHHVQDCSIHAKNRVLVSADCTAVKTDANVHLVYMLFFYRYRLRACYL